MVEDPVCGMDLMPEDVVAQLDYKGETYFFCSEECRDEFEREPDQYAIPVHEPAF